MPIDLSSSLKYQHSHKNTHKQTQAHQSRVPTAAAAMVMAKTAARKLLARGAIAQTLADAGVGFGVDGAWEFIKAKAAALAAFFAHLFAALAEKADELFPPAGRSETLHRWLRVAVTIVLPAALGVLALYFIARCCVRCCCAAGRRMMRAPGRRGMFMPRGAFEGDPRQYFRDLRGGQPLLY